MLIAILMFSLLAMYGFTPLVKAASLESAKDTLSDSTPSATPQHTIVFDMATELSQNEYVQITFGTGFGSAATASTTCPANTSSSTAATYVRCTVDSGQTLASTSAQTIKIENVTNPATTGAKDITVSTHQSGGTEIESSGIKVYIIDQVTITATVDASLQFQVLGLATSTDVNTVATTGSSSPTFLKFGTIDSTASATLAQQLEVTTNADGGYTVTVEQDGNMLNGAGASIDAFVDGTPSGGAAWQAPGGTLGNDNEYGHMGLTSEDANLSGGDDFADGLYAGFTGTTPVEVMYHTGPADGSTANIGVTQVAYTIEITDLQEAGDYSNTLTYICTPTY